MKKVLIIDGHPNSKSFCAGLAQSYADKSKAAGHEIQLQNVRDLKFDPNMRQGYSSDQSLEPDLVDAQKKILWADHIVWVYPNWWGSPPALLKGFIDRVLLPGFAFKYVERGFPLGLLKGRSTELIVTLDTPPIIYKFLMGAPGLKVMKNAVLKFCGLKFKGTHLYGPIRGSSPEKRTKWLAELSVVAK